MNIYVGNLSRASIITDKFSGEPKGFGFVEMSNQSEAKAAIDGMSGKELHGRTLNVSEARPREERSGGNRMGGGGDRNGGGRRSW
jgi:RNA recognition motif-containing protein